MGLFVLRDVMLMTGALYFRYKTLQKCVGVQFWSIPFSDYFIQDSVADLFNPYLNSEKIKPILISKVKSIENTIY